MTREHREYIYDMFKHSSYKKYENGILNELYWTLVNKKGIELKLVTQQTVFRADDINHVAYMDGYFPALNLQIEIDESHHKFQKHADVKREDDIMCILGAIQHNVKPAIIRIDTTKDIGKQIDDCIKFIEKRYHDFNEPQ